LPFTYLKENQKKQPAICGPIQLDIYRPREGCGTMRHRIRGEKELWLKGRKANEYTCRKR